MRPHQIEYAIASGQVAEPLIRFLGKRVFCDKDVQRVAAFFGISLDDQSFIKESQ